MKKLTLLSILLVSLLHSQNNIKYSFGQEFETVRKHADMGFYQIEKNVFAEVYYRTQEDMIFQIYDEKFNNIKKQETTSIKMEEGYETEGLFCVKNDFYFLYSTWHRKEEQEQLWALPLDKKTFKLGSKPIKLAESGRLALNTGKYHFDYSADSTMMLMTDRLKPTERRDRFNKDIIGFYLFDSQMKSLYSHQIEMPYTEADMDILDKEIDSKGNIYLLAQVKLNNSVDGETKENRGLYRYELMRVNQKDNVMQAIKIGLDGKFTNDVVLSEDLKHDIIITGYYSSRKGGGSDGAYIIRMEYDDKNSVKKLNTTYCEFPKQVLQAYESERTKRKMEEKEKDDKLEASNLNLRKVVFGIDGSVTIIGEEYYVVQHTYYNGRTTTTTYTYYYNDILVLKADKDGKTVWCCKIPKYQKGAGTADLGFHHHTYKGDNYFFYLDNAKNANLSLNETPAQHMAGRGGFLTAVKIDAEGKMSKQSIFDIKEEDIKLQPRGFESVSETLIVDRLKEDRKTSKVFRLEIK
jgi:hypothetical protein